MPAYPPMACSLQTARLTLRPWVEADVDAYRALVAERGDGLPAVEDIRGRITTQRATTAQTGLALLPILRRGEGDLIGYCGLLIGRATLDEPAAATGRTRLWATVRTWNTPSFRVLDALRFERAHVSTDNQGELVWLTRELP